MSVLLSNDGSLNDFVRINGLDVSSIHEGSTVRFELNETTARIVINNLLEALGYPTIDVYKSETDGVTVIHVDTEGLPENDQGPLIRVYLNDHAIEENPVYPGLPV